MVSTAFWLLLVWRFRYRPFSIFVHVYLVLIAVSRVHVAAHYPDQVVSGSVFGFFVAHCVHDTWPSLQRLIASLPLIRRLQGVFVVGVSAFLFVLAQYYLLSLWFDPLHSVQLATNACRITGGIHLTTGPLIGVMRDIGVVIGAGFSLCISLKDQQLGKSSTQQLINQDFLPPSSWGWAVCRVFVGQLVLGAIAWLSRKTVPNANGISYSLHACLIFFAYGISMVLVVPRATHSLETLSNKLQDIFLRSSKNLSKRNLQN
eukprot:c10363_g1_i1.p1 GENE.c10363_g1_i1~~c10363_g1_i1.p1  ORF type:complete len:260 (-),score=44.58 c10363_g1_i1:26-805(-)